MTRRTRWIAALTLLAVLLVVAGGWLLESVSIERRFVASRVSAILGLEVEIAGEVKLELLPIPHLEATGVSIGNLPGRPGPHLAEIGTLAIGFNVWRRLWGIFEITRLLVRDAEIHIEPDESGGYTYAGPAKSGPESANLTSFRFRRLEGDDVKVSIRTPGGALIGIHFEELSVDSAHPNAPVTLSAAGEMDGSRFDVDGEFGPVGELFDPTAPYAAYLEGRMLEADVRLDGKIAQPLELRGIDLKLYARVPDLGAIAREPDPALTRIGPVTVTGHLTDPEGTLRVDHLVLATTRSDPIASRLTGSIGDLLSFKGIDLRLEFDANDPRLLPYLLDRPIARASSIRGSASLDDREGPLGLKGKAEASFFGDQVEVRVEGAYRDLSRIQDIDARARLEARDLGVLGRVLGIEHELPPIGPVSASARLRDWNGALGADEIDVHVGNPKGDAWLAITGFIHDFRNRRGVKLAAEFRAVDLRHARPWLSREPPDIGPIRGTASIADADGSLGIERFELKGGREGVFEIDLAGSFDDVARYDEIEMHARVEARDIQVIGTLLDADLPRLGPVEFEGRVVGSDEKLDSQGKLRLNKTTLTGDWSASFAPGQRPSLKARARSPHVFLSDVGLDPETLREAPPTPPLAAIVPLEVASPVEGLRAFDADVVLHADQVSGRYDFNIRDAHAEIDLRRGELTVDEVRLVADDGRVEARLYVDARSQQPSGAVRVDVSGLDLTRLMLQLQEETKTAGVLDVVVDLESRGATARALRSNLSGDFQVMMRNGTLASKWARKFTMSFLRLTFPTLPTLLGDAPPPPLSCGMADLDIEGGVAKIETLILDGPDVLVTGVGTIDFGRDEIQATLTPHAKNPGLVSVAATVAVSGPLTDPRYRAQKRSLATSLARGVLSNAMRPARAVLQPFRRDVKRAEEICAVPLRRGPPHSAE